MSVRDRERIAWSDLEPLPRRQPIDGLAERMKLSALQQRRVKHKSGKAHATNQERSQADRAKAAELRKTTAAKDAAWSAYKDAVRAYWTGERETHP